MYPGIIGMLVVSFAKKGKTFPIVLITVFLRYVDGIKHLKCQLMDYRLEYILHKTSPDFNG